MVAKPDPQAGMFDVELDDPDFEGAIREWIAFKPQRTELAKIERRIAEGKERNNIKSLEDGTRVRLGEYTFEAKARSGGGFPMPQWETVGIAGIRELGGPPDLKVVE
jgi:hypothetical protein